MVWQRFRSAVGWMPLVVGLMALLGGVSELELAARCTSEAQRLTLQELLDGQAGENRHVAVTDFQPCGRYVLRQSSRSNRDTIPYFGVEPAHAESGGGPSGPPRVLIEPQYSLQPAHFPGWSQRPTISGVLEKPRTLTQRDEQELRETYPGIDLPSCRILHEGRKPQPVRESWTYVGVGVFGVTLGGWMLYPGLLPLVWKRLRGVTAARPAGGQTHDAGTGTPPGLPVPRTPVAARETIRREERGPTARAPLPARILAVAYVLSLAVQPIGFILLVGIACWLWVKRGWDGSVLAFGLGGVGCIAFCMAFRGWVRRWGRRHWPDEDGPGGETERGADSR